MMIPYDQHRVLDSNVKVRYAIKMTFAAVLPALAIATSAQDALQPTYLFTNRLENFGYWSHRPRPIAEVGLFTPLPVRNLELRPDYFIDHSASMESALNRMYREAEKLQPHDPMILLYIHGYNSSVKASLNRGDEIRGGLMRESLRPLVTHFSWSSDASPVHYNADVEDARLAAPALAATLEHLIGLKQKRKLKLVLVIHSLGNLILQEAAKIVRPIGNDRPIWHTIMVAPDLPWHAFSKGDLNALAAASSALNMMPTLRRTCSSKMWQEICHGRLHSGPENLFRSAPITSYW
jgi:hypothetical protein